MGLGASLLTRLRRLLAPDRLSPIGPLEAAPPAIAVALQGRRVEALPASPSPKRHWMYGLDDSLLLHVYGYDDGRIRRSLPERLEMQREVELPGLPVVRAAAREPSRVWVLEDRLRGAAPDSTSVRQWFPLARDWLVRLAGPPGPPLRDTRFWSAHYEDALGVCPAELRGAVAGAWEMLGDLPSRTLHGDAQPKNLVLGPHGVGLVDWEGFWRYGIPGLDLVFLALMSARRVPDPKVIETLALGFEPTGKPVRGALAELGLGEGRLRPGLLAMLSIWAAGETRRLQRGRQGGRASAFPFASALASCGPVLREPGPSR